MNEKVSVVIPVYQNEKLIEGIVRDIHQEIISKLPNSEFIVAEDGSTDHTKEILKRLSKEIPFTLISSEQKKGYMKAMKESLKTAKNDLIFFTDSDGEQDVKDFWKLHHAIYDCDMVIGYKTNRRPIYRMMLSHFNNLLFSILFGLHLRDANSGFRLIRKRVIDAIVDEVTIMPIAPNAEFAIRAKKTGFIIKEVPTKHRHTPSVVFSPLRMPKVIYKQLKDILRLKINISQQGR